ncbi:hypothetical protein RB598_005366 [Gaeumannomyces tritici]
MSSIDKTPTPAAPAVAAAMAARIRVAIIGLSPSAKGSWAEESHLAYLLSPLGRSHYDVVALLNSTVEDGAATVERFGFDAATVKTYADPAALAADPNVDLVVCCTTARAHAAAVGPSLRAGKAAYVEWPVAGSLAAALELADDVECGRNALPPVGAGIESPSSTTDGYHHYHSGASSNSSNDGNGPDRHHHLHLLPAQARGGKRLGAESSMIGLQGRLSPVVLKISDLLDSGRVGRVLSSDVRAFGSMGARDSVPRSLAHSADRADGRSPITEVMAHVLDYVHEVLGEFERGTVRCRMQLQRSTMRLLGKAGDGGEGASVEMESDVPDLVVLHGQLAAGRQQQSGGWCSSPEGRGGGSVVVEDGATLSIMYRSGPPFKGEPAFVWTINCERGEILVTSPQGPYLHSDSYAAAGLDAPDEQGRRWLRPETITIRVHDHVRDEVVNVHWDWEDWQRQLPVRARIVARLYERFWRRWTQCLKEGEAAGQGGGGGGRGIMFEDDDWPRIEDGVTRMRQLDELFRQYDKARTQLAS